jgi:hypothetical protein
MQARQNFTGLRVLDKRRIPSRMLKQSASILLKFSCQPIDHHAGHFRYSFPGLL